MSSCNGDVTIVTSEDALPLQSCPTYTGTVSISSEAAGAINLDGISNITGNLECGGASQLLSMSADRLEKIGGWLDLENLDILSSLELPALTDVNIIWFDSLPALQTPDLGTDGIANVGQIYIRNTGLSYLEYFNPAEVVSISVYNNPYLKTVSMPRLANITNTPYGLNISQNNPSLVVNFPNLQSAVGSMEIQNVGLISIPPLFITGSQLSISNCSMLSNLTIPKIMHAGGDIILRDIENIHTVSFPNLNTINGSLVLLENSGLNSMYFGSLSAINGSLDIYGTNASISFPDLRDVAGGVNVSISNDSATVCNMFNELKQSGVIKGRLDFDIPTSTASSEPSFKASSDLSGGAIAGVVVGTIVVVMIMGIIVFFCLRRRRRSTVNNSTAQGTEPRHGHHQLPLGGHHEKVELDANHYHPQINEMNGVSTSSMSMNSATKPVVIASHETSPATHREASESSKNHAAVAELSGQGSTGRADQNEKDAALHKIQPANTETRPPMGTGGNDPPDPVCGDNSTSTTGAPASKPVSGKMQSVRVSAGQSWSRYDNEAVM